MWSVVGSFSSSTKAVAKLSLNSVCDGKGGTVVIVGEEEWSRGEAEVRDMTSGEQRPVALDDLVGELTKDG